MNDDAVSYMMFNFVTKKQSEYIWNASKTLFTSKLGLI